mgnify:CR=1 FL=1
MSAQRQYPAKIDRIVDGDTMDLTIDLGFGISKSVRIRLAYVNTDEIFGVSHYSDEYHKGMKQKMFVNQLLPVGTDVTFISHEETGKYGRPIGDIEVNGQLLSESILEQFKYLDQDYGSNW